MHSRNWAAEHRLGLPRVRLFQCDVCLDHRNVLCFHALVVQNEICPTLTSQHLLEGRRVKLMQLRGAALPARPFAGNGHKASRTLALGLSLYCPRDLESDDRAEGKTQEGEGSSSFQGGPHRRDALPHQLLRVLDQGFLHPRPTAGPPHLVEFEVSQEISPAAAQKIVRRALSSTVSCPAEEDHTRRVLRILFQALQPRRGPGFGLATPGTTVTLRLLRHPQVFLKVACINERELIAIFVPCLEQRHLLLQLRALRDTFPHLAPRGYHA
mmetsp:Transcript_11676/g.31392  ORF Transcript_11676/g.31392 Transcript_11676/m.31392 type:complete len:269 (-) Transcript_11676:696-1502(-)